MGKINVVLEDKLEEKFRRTIFESKGMKKGNISEAIEEAIDLWIERETKSTHSRKDKK